MIRVLVLSSQSGDWEALYVDGELIDEYHSLTDIDPHFLWRKGLQYDFGPDEIVYKELNDKDEEYANDNGCMPDDITKYLK